VLAKSERLNQRRHVGVRGDLGDELFDLALGPITSAGEQLDVVFGRQVRGEQEDAGKVDRGIGEHLEDQRKLPGQARGATPALGFVLRQAQFVNAIRPERCASPLAIDAAGVDLGEVGEEMSGELVRASEPEGVKPKMVSVQVLERFR
jgi:hypothetical protein